MGSITRCASNGNAPSLLVVAQNVSSLHKYAEDIGADADMRQADVMFSETRAVAPLAAEVVPGFEVLMQVYASETDTAPRHGSVLMVRAGSVAKYTECRAGESDGGIEILQTTVQRDSPLRLVAVYRSPASSLPAFWDKLQLCLSSADSQELLMIGDFNINMLPPHDAAAARLQTLMAAAGTRQLVQGPTFRLGSLIDHAWTNATSATSGTLATYISDHLPVWAACGSSS